MIFAQSYQPGEQCQSDFTHCKEFEVTIQRQAFPHLLYHFVLAYSNWEHATICFSECFEGLLSGLQNALWELGTVPQEHRTDILSTAVNNLKDPEEFTERYQALLNHYGLLSERVRDGIQLSTDGFTPYLDAVRIAFLEKVVHYGQIVKVYAAARPGPARYSPPRFTSAQRDEVYGRPDREHISTSLIERKNLTLRMHLRRFTRLTNAFSKKLDNLRAALSLHFAFYNFCRRHSSIKQTPAMAAGLTDHVWSIMELLEEAAALS